MTNPATDSGSPRRRNWPFTAGAIVFLVLNLLLALPGADAKGSGTAYTIGSVLGAAVVSLLLVGLVYWVARLLARGKRRVELPRVALWTLGVVFGLSFVTMVTRAGQRLTASVVTDAERGALTVEPDSIRHASLGFSLPNPGTDFGPDPDLQRRMDAGFAKHRDIAAWVLRRADPPATVMIEVTKMSRMD